MRFNSLLKGQIHEVGSSNYILCWMLCYMADAWYQRREDVTSCCSDNSAHSDNIPRARIVDTSCKVCSMD